MYRQIMALVIHQVQGSYAPSRPSWKRGIKSTKGYCIVESMDINLLKHTSCLCGEPPLTHGSNRKSLKIVSFKGSAQSNEYKDGVSGSKSGNKSVILSNIFRSNNMRAHCTSDTDVTTVGSLAMHKLFLSWSMFSPLTSTKQDETLERPSSNERVDADQKLLKEGFFKKVWGKFLGMDATIKIPAIMFVPLFLIINMKYGANVAKELSPLWIGGPLLLALYIKIVHVICSLYIFSFKHLVKVVKNFTNDQEFIGAHLWRRVVYFRNLDYKNESNRIWEEFKTWFEDKCFDFVESVWSYRGMVGFLKMANIK